VDTYTVATWPTWRPGHTFESRTQIGLTEDYIRTVLHSIPFVFFGGTQGVLRFHDRLWTESSRHIGSIGEIVRDRQASPARRILIEDHPANLGESYIAGRAAIEGRAMILSTGELDVGTSTVYNACGFRWSSGRFTDLLARDGVIDAYVEMSRNPVNKTAVTTPHDCVAMAVSFSGDDWIAELRLGHLITIDLKKHVGKESMIFSSFDNLEDTLGLTDLKSIFPFGSHDY
jgi:hypothetical protein